MCRSSLLDAAAGKLAERAGDAAEKASKAAD